MSIKKTAGIVSPPVTTNVNPKGEKLTLTNGLPTPPVTSFSVRPNDGIVSPSTVPDRVQSQNGNIPQNSGDDRGKGIVTPPAVTRPVPPPSTDQSSGKKK